MNVLHAIIDKRDNLLLISGGYAKVHGGMPIVSNAYPSGESVFPSSMQYGGTLEHDGGVSSTLTDGQRMAQVLVYYDGTLAILANECKLACFVSFHLQACVVPFDLVLLPLPPPLFLYANTFLARRIWYVY